MNKDVRPYLRDILERIHLIREFSAAGREDFFASRKTQESIIRCFEVIGEAIKRLPSELTVQEPSIPWHAFAGFRDVLIHQYEKVDYEVVWDTVENDLDELERGVKLLIEILNKDENTDETI